MSILVTPLAIQSQDTDFPRICIGGTVSTKLYARFMQRYSAMTDTRLEFGTAYRLNNEAGYDNKAAIITKITGLK